MQASSAVPLPCQAGWHGASFFAGILPVKTCETTTLPLKPIAGCFRSGAAGAGLLCFSSQSRPVVPSLGIRRFGTCSNNLRPSLRADYAPQLARHVPPGTSSRADTPICCFGMEGQLRRLSSSPAWQSRARNHLEVLAVAARFCWSMPPSSRHGWPFIRRLIGRAGDIHCLNPCSIADLAGAVS